MFDFERMENLYKEGLPNTFCYETSFLN